jgi:hypothetical protein
VRIAYAVHGDGPPLLISTCWLSHLQFDWEEPGVATLRVRARAHCDGSYGSTNAVMSLRIGTLPIFLSNRGSATSKAVADDAGFDRFAMMAMAQGGRWQFRMQVRHRSEVSRLMFTTAMRSQLRGMTAEDIELEDAFDHVIKAGWGRPESTFRRVFSSMMIPRCHRGTDELA